MIGGPDVVEELDLDDGLQAPGGEADRPAHDVGLGERRVVDALAAELALQPPDDLEDAALPLHDLEELRAAAIGHVFAEGADAGVAGPPVLDAGFEEGGVTRACTRAGPWRLRQCSVARVSAS